MTALNSLMHVLRLGALALGVMQTGQFQGMQWPSGDRLHQMLVLGLLATDATQALLLSVLVSQEEIEEAGMSYLLIVWTLFRSSIPDSRWSPDGHSAACCRLPAL